MQIKQERKRKHMNNKEVNINNTFYNISTKYYLKALLEQGLITKEEFDKIDKTLYQAYHMDKVQECIDENRRSKIRSFGSNSKPSPSPQIEFVHENERVPDDINSASYVSITDIARIFNANPSYVIQSWLRSNKVVEFLKLWEKENNTDFDINGCNKLIEKMKTTTFTLTAKQWKEQTKAIGIKSKQGKNGGTFAHPIIACEFMMWLSPEFKLNVIKLAQFITDEKHK